jgi:CubicO group peptidase (beta-lactamase class C family)
VTVLAQIDAWPVRAAAGWLNSGQTETYGPVDEVFEWASVTKVVTALTVWIAVEEGTVALDDEAGPRGSTLAHLLAHASGLDVDTTEVLAPPGHRRIYSNSGIEAAADHVAEAAGIPFRLYASEAVLEPLGLSGTTVVGSPASGGRGPLTDLLRLAAELRVPTLVSPETLSRATAVSFPGLSGILPGFGHQAPNDWGLGVELRSSKRPHWTGSANSPETFGHFGRSGSWIWVDPVAGVAAASLADQPFGPWATTAWPALSNAILVSAARAERRSAIQPRADVWPPTTTTPRPSAP